MFSFTQLIRLINALDISVIPPVPAIDNIALQTEISSVISMIYSNDKLRIAFTNILDKLNNSKRISPNTDISLNVLRSDRQLDGAIRSVSSKLNRFYNWRSDEKPKFNSPTIHPAVESLPEDQDIYRKVCTQQYQLAMDLMEHSVCDLSLEYVTRNPFAELKENKNNNNNTTDRGILLDFANEYSQRYLDLLEAYIDWEISKGIPVLPVTAGQMKIHGFTSDDIWKMKTSCQQFTQIHTDIKTLLNNDKKSLKIIMEIMGNQNKSFTRQEFVAILKNTKFEQVQATLRKMGINFTYKEYKQLLNAFERYDRMPEVTLMDKAIMLMHDFAHMNLDDIAMQFYYVGIAKSEKTYVQHAKDKGVVDDVKHKDNKEERLLMEIRHRIAGDMSVQQNSPGSVGGNPQAYLNMLRKGEPNNPLAEFREKMYFVYMCNHFANAVMRNDENFIERIVFINTWLREHKKGWQLDMQFIQALLERGADYLPPIFRYGANAALNRQLRDVREHDEVEEFYRQNPNIPVRRAMEGSYDLEDYYRYELSQRELFNQLGELVWDPDDLNRTWKQLNFGTGAAVFKLKKKPTNEMSPEAKAYIEEVQKLSLPVYAGISGTLDQSTAMAGLVGIGTELDENERRKTLEIIRLAYLAFMLPGRDHSVHEIMQSSKTYGLEYVPGPDYEQYIFPRDKQYVKSRLKELQKERGSNLPSYYLSKEFVQSTACKDLVAESKMTTPSTLPQQKPIVSPGQENYFIGLNVGGSELAHVLKKKFEKCSEQMTWVKDSNLHITIGWLDQPISPALSKQLFEQIKTKLSKLEKIDVDMVDVELWGASQDKNDVILTLNAEIMEVIRKDLAQSPIFAKDLKLEWHNPVHIKIGEIKDPHLLPAFKEALKQKDGLKSKGFSFDQCAVMHTHSYTGIIQTDFEIALKARKKVEKQPYSSKGIYFSKRISNKENLENAKATLNTRKRTRNDGIH